MVKVRRVYKGDVVDSQGIIHKDVPITEYEESEGGKTLLKREPFVDGSNKFAFSAYLEQKREREFLESLKKKK